MIGQETEGYYYEPIVPLIELVSRAYRLCLLLFGLNGIEGILSFTTQLVYPLQHPQGMERHPLAWFTLDLDVHLEAPVEGVIQLPSPLVVLLRDDQVDGLLHAGVVVAKPGENPQNLQCVCLPHPGEAEPAPAWFADLV